MEKRYSRNPLFRPLILGRSHYLCRENGARIRTDKTINLIWETAQDLPAEQIRSKIAARAPISSWLFEQTLALMEKADLLTTGDRPAAGPSAAPDTGAAGPLVSIVIVNKDGSEHLKTLLPSIARQRYRNIEIIMVDNASKDDSVELTRSSFPEAKIIELRKNIGFAPGNNVGIAEARGELIFLLNNDTELDDDCVGALAAAAAGRDDLAAVVPKIFLWKLPAFLNAIGNSVRNRGWGGDNYIGYLDIGQFDGIEEVFSACFGAAMIRRPALDQIGLLDPVYKFYYEDADWSYRARLAGLKIGFAPGAKVYHKFNASMNTLTPNFKWRLVIRNRLRFATKNLSAGTWLNFMRHYLKEDIRGFLGSVKRRNPAMAATYVRAWLGFLVGLPRVLLSRRRIQRGRVVSDADLIKLWPELPPLTDDGGNPILDLATVRRIYVHFTVESPKNEVERLSKEV